MEDPITLMRRVSERSVNVSNIIRTNDISRKYCEGKMSLEEAYEALKHARGKQYSRFFYNVATVGIAVGFAIMLETPKKYLVHAGIVGTVGWFVYLLAGKLGAHDVFARILKTPVSVF